MPIDAVNGVTTNAMTNALTSVSGTSSDVAGTAGATSTDGSGFAASLGNAVDGLQASTRYPGGVALRFARVLRYRDDKGPDEVDTLTTVRALGAPLRRLEE